IPSNISPSGNPEHRTPDRRNPDILQNTLKIPKTIPCLQLIRRAGILSAPGSLSWFILFLPCWIKIMFFIKKDWMTDIANYLLVKICKSIKQADGLQHNHHIKKLYIFI